MFNLPPTLTLACIGLLLYFVLFVLWKKGASRWSTWFPIFQRGAQILMWLALGVLSIAALATLKSVDSAQTGLVALGFGAAILPVVGLFSKKKTSERHERGASVESAPKVRALVKRERKGYDLEWGKVPVPHDAEPYHFLIAGSTGSGKSVAIKELLDTIRARGDVAIVVDSGGEFLSRYWNEESDYVLNPFDERCAPWSPTGDLAGPWDAEALARSIIPDGTGDSKEWNGYAQTLLTSCLQVLWEQNKKSLADLLYMVQAASIKELSGLLGGTAAASQLTSDKMFGSIRTIASKYLSAYSYLISAPQPFSVSRFIRESRNGFLFLTYRDDQLDSLRNLISCVLDIAARTILSLKPDPKRRIWLVIDEFASIGKVQSIEAVATKARKVGGCLVLGLQSVSQVKDRYGDNAAQSILSCLSTWLVLRCADADTAEYMSKYIGEEQVVRTSEGASSSDSGGSKSWSEQTTTQRVVLASEIQKLANVHGFLKIAGHYPVCQLKLQFPPNKQDAVEPFIARDFNRTPMMKFQAAPVLEKEAISAGKTPKLLGTGKPQSSPSSPALAGSKSVGGRTVLLMRVPK